jgi:hypothetical protein
VAARRAMGAVAFTTVLWLHASCRIASSATLQDLFNGGTIDAGNARFSDWQLASLDVTAPPNPNLALINVTPLVDMPASPGLQFAMGGQLSIAGLNALDLVFSYRVSAIGGGNSFTGHALSVTGLTFGGAGGAAYVSQDATDLGGGNLGPAVAIADHEIDFFQLTANAAHAPHLGVMVHMNIFLNGLATEDTINLSAFTQRFTQTGPTTVAGDFTLDQRVDGADFLLWQRGGSPSSLSSQDLSAWRLQYGDSAAAAAVASAIPEPAAAVLTVFGAYALLFRLVVPGRSHSFVAQRAVFRP